MKLLIGSQNPGKVREYQRLLADLPFTVVGLADVNLAGVDVPETGTTFEENALLKATAYAQTSGLLALGDDSGLVVDALDGRPGVYSARYGPSGADDAGRRAHLLAELAAVPYAARTARFICVIAVVDPRTGSQYTVEGVCEGHILLEERDGGHGFGYDAIFQPVGFDRTFAELPAEKKNHISHRGVAVAQLPDVLARIPRE